MLLLMVLYRAEVWLQLSDHRWSLFIDYIEKIHQHPFSLTTSNVNRQCCSGTNASPESMSCHRSKVQHFYMGHSMISRGVYPHVPFTLEVDPKNVKGSTDLQLQKRLERVFGIAPVPIFQNHLCWPWNCWQSSPIATQCCRDAGTSVVALALASFD